MITTIQMVELFNIIDLLQIDEITLENISYQRYGIPISDLSESQAYELIDYLLNELDENLFSW